MKRKSVLFIAVLSVILLSVTASILFAQKSKSISMESRWKQVEQYAQKAMPESALKEVDAILAQAAKEKNSPEVIKAMVYKMRFTLDKNPDEAPKLIREFEDFTNKSTNPVEKALLRSMTAELYQKYYENDSYNINQRTEMTGHIPDDIKEWTKNIFVDKITVYAESSLENPEILQKTDALSYIAILEKGKDSREMKPTLFDFLAYRKIELLKNTNSAINPDETKIQNKIIETYNQIIDFQKQKKNIPAQVYAELQKLQFENPNQEEKYLEELSKLEKQFAGNEAVVEVLAAKAQYFMNDAEDATGKSENKKIAYDIAADGIRKYPGYKRIGLLKNIQNSILQKNIQVEYNKAVKPQVTLKLALTSRNLTELQISVYKANTTATEYYNFMMNRRNDKSLYPNRTQVETRTVNIKSDPNFGEVKTNVELKTGDYGIYEFVLEEKGNKKDNEKAIGSFTVTDFTFIQRTNQEKTSDIYVLDRIQGTPVKDVTVSTYNNKWDGNKYQINFVKKYVTDANGLSTLSIPNSYYDNLLFFEKGKDRYFNSQTYSYFNNDKEPAGENTVIALFTDRSLYRPGQTLYFKGIAYIAAKNKQEVVKNTSYTVILYNDNGEKISDKAVKTNEFGSFAGEFILPESGLNGSYRLEVATNSINFWVEEYKRPTFEVTVNRPKDEVRFGENVTVKGNVKAYAGYAISDAQVKYRVVRRPHRFWWWSDQSEQIISNGTTTSNGDGIFEISFIPKKNKTPEISWFRGDNSQYYTYTVYADVTDPKGETQKGEQTISVGDKSLFILAEIPDKVEKNKPLTVDVTTQTLNGETVPSTIKYSVVKLQASNDYYENLNDTTKFKELETVTSGTLETNDKLVLDMKKMTSGMYKVIFATKDSKGNEVKLEDRFMLYDTADKRPAVKMYTWLLTPKTEVVVNETAQIKFGTSTKNTRVLYELMQENTVLEKRWIDFNDEIKTFDIPFKESYGGGVTALFTFVKDEHFFTQSVRIIRKVEEKKLSPTLSVFRDKLKPGEKAEWTIHIPKTDNDKNSAELLIGMYDASLDALRPHNWSFNPTYMPFVPYSPVWFNKGFETDNAYAWFTQTYKEVPGYEFDQLNWFGLPLGNGRWYGGGRVVRMHGAGSLKSANAANEQVMAMTFDSKVELQEVVTVKDMTVAKVKKDSENNTSEKTQIRTNFNETAFFYPQLHTDKDGNIKVSFTAPESLTRWNIKMLAHTQDLYFGQNEMQAITQKELMVQMNLPRFVRKSDKLVLAANVTNLSETPLIPTVKLEIIDPETNKIINPLPSKGGISVRPKETVAFEWELAPLENLDLVIVKIVAETGQFSDGEQKYLPVLPDKVLVTESQAMTIRANQTRTFSFDSFINQLKNVNTRNFAVEFASNPTWYAVQALPTLAEPAHENAIDYLTAYYANTLAAYIANANPKIAAMFDRWKNAGGSRDALLSNLQKNQELKNMLLEETPWVMEAKDETEQKRQIALLFDLNQQKNQSEKYLDKLLKLQTPNGGFSWFEKMPESRYVTQEVLLDLARLNKMTKKSASEKENDAVKKALNYLDLMLAKDFVELKKYNKDFYKQNVINNLQLFYLHMRSEYKDVPVAATAKEALTFYTAQSEKYWTSFTLYGKAMMATVAFRNGNTLVANEILKSLKENAMKTDELGMYWAKNTSGWWWHERPIAVQTAMIEAFTEIAKNNSDADEMKIWLLKQKQTQRWDTPISTTDAIYALLNYGADWLSNNGEVVIKLGNNTLKPQSKEAGTGYFKEEIPANTLKPEMGKITVENKNSTGIGWGAAYWQYYQDLDKVKGQGKEMNISKKLFVEKVENNKKTMMPIEQTTLKKGDKIITRLVLTTDRDMEFVALKDLRAACFEPVNQNSGYQWRDGAGYYYTIKDASTQYFFDFLPKGTYVFEYEVWANNSGTFTSGITSIQCLYAPEFVSHTGSEKITVGNK